MVSYVKFVSSFVYSSFLLSGCRRKAVFSDRDSGHSYLHGFSCLLYNCVMDLDACIWSLGLNQNIIMITDTPVFLLAKFDITFI